MCVEVGRVQSRVYGGTDSSTSTVAAPSSSASSSSRLQLYQRLELNQIDAPLPAHPSRTSRASQPPCPQQPPKIPTTEPPGKKSVKKYPHAATSASPCKRPQTSEQPLITEEDPQPSLSPARLPDPDPDPPSLRRHRRPSSVVVVFAR